MSDDGDNNEKTKNQKTLVGMFKNMGGNFPGGTIKGPISTYETNQCLFYL